MGHAENHELYQKVWTRVHDIVDELTKDLAPEDDEEIRQILNETFRFWRR